MEQLASQDKDLSLVCHRNEQWAIDVDASKESPLDPIVTILDAELQPVLRTQLLATRESYFTFRGKDSMQVAISVCSIGKRCT